MLIKYDRINKKNSHLLSKEYGFRFNYGTLSNQLKVLSSIDSIVINIYHSSDFHIKAVYKNLAILKGFPESMSIFATLPIISSRNFGSAPYPGLILLTFS